MSETTTETTTAPLPPAPPSQTTRSDPKGLHPDETFIPESVVPGALIHQITTPTVPIEGDAPVVRVPYVTDLPNAVFTNEDTEIEESSAGLDEVKIYTRKLALLHRASRESVANSTAAEIIGKWMTTAVTHAADKYLLTAQEETEQAQEIDTTPMVSGATGEQVTPEQPKPITWAAGLANYPGHVDAGTMTAGDLDVLSDAITEIEGNGATATHIVMDPKSWGKLRKLKTATGSAQLLLGNPGEQTEKRLFGIPVILSAQLPAGTVLALDRNDILSSTGDIQLSKSTDFYFNRDSVAYRITWRFGWNLIHPNRLAKVTVDLTA